MNLPELNRRIRRWLYGPAPEIPQELREVTHQQNNETMALTGLINRLRRENETNGPAHRAPAHQ